MRVRLLDDAQLLPLASGRERVREEVFATVTLSRASLLRRLSGENSGCDWPSVVDELVRVGDITLGKGGVLASAPLRVVDRSPEPAFWIGTTPRRWLSRQAPTFQLDDELPRRTMCPLGDEVREFIGRIEGIVISAERWSGIEDVVPWTSWLERLAERELPSPGGLPVPPDAEVQFYHPGIGFRKDQSEGRPRLFRFRERGFWSYCFQGFGFVALTPDEAVRTQLAFDASAGTPRVVSGETAPGGRRLTIPFFLPRAEYRFLLSLAGSVSREGGAIVAEFQQEAASRFLAFLSTRHGVLSQGGSSQPTSPMAPPEPMI